MNTERIKTGKFVIQSVLLLVAVALFRLIYVDIYEMLIQATHFSLVAAALSFFSNYWALILSVALDLGVLSILYRYIPYGVMPFRRPTIYFIGIITNSALGTFVIHHKTLLNGNINKEDGYLILGTYIAVLLFNVIFILLADLLVYFKRTRKEIRIQSDKKNRAQYQYNSLKQQLNPHFLFNSLNVLDYLVQQDEKQRASDYIKKLAGVYRYLLNMGECTVVRLEEEINFVKLYVELIKERFTDGLEVYINIPEEYMDTQIIPCGIQILVENATKHNIVNTKTPLIIDICVNEEEEKIVVENNLQRKLNAPSNGVGLKNINKQYQDVAGKEIEIIPSETTFLVKLPIIYPLKNKENIGGFEENNVPLSAKSM